jgi:UDP-glucose 4-epimerase
MKIFITGGTGNIGQYITKALSDAGHELLVYTRTPERVPALGQLTGVSLLKGDILDLDVMEQALEGCDAVIHNALGWGNTPVEMLMHDTRVTVSLMEMAEKAGVRNFVYTSSTAAMGRFFDGMDETVHCQPTDLYGATKASSEAFLLGFCQYYSGQGAPERLVSMRRNVIRPGYTFSNPAFEGGASQSDKRFRNIARAVLKGENISWSINDGTQFLSSAQLAQVYIRLIESELNKEIVLALGSTFTTWVEIIQMAIDLVPSTATKLLIPDGEVKRKPELITVNKLNRLFGLSFDATGDLREHVKWNINRERKVLAGESVHNVYHGW